jgi:hypothetical protein
MEENDFSFEWEELPDLTSSSEVEIKGYLQSLVRREAEISYRRRVLQGRIDILRAELVRRGEAFVPVEDLAQVLMGDRTEHDSFSPGETSGPENLDAPDAPDAPESQDSRDEGGGGSAEWKGS